MLILLDNGSLEPAAVLALRETARRLGEQLGEPVAPVSLLHSGKIPAERLDGVPADTLIPFLSKQAAAGVTAFRILPFFIGPSLALTEYLPERLAVLREKHPSITVDIAPSLAGDDAGEALIAEILAERLREMTGELSPATKVILCDHGSPAREVTAVRDRLAARLRELTGITAILPASMERREGADYDFNEPLLATALSTPPYDNGEVTIAMLFLQPGRHAGPVGDIARICADAESAHPGLMTRRTALLGSHPRLLGLLARRARTLTRP